MPAGKIVKGDARDFDNYPEHPFHLTVSSPPYFVGKKYEEDYSFEEYKDLLKTVFQNVAKKTVPGGKIAINIADIAAFSKVSGIVEENIEVSRDLAVWLKEVDCHLLARIIWAKDLPWVNSQHVGYNDKIPATYVRVLPSAEYIWVYYKGSPKREDLGDKKITNVLSKEDWKQWVSGVWNIKSVQANNEHEAMFPEELVRRLVLMYSVEGDTVFDPFSGSGTTAVVAHKNGRNYAGIERDPKFYKLCLKNLETCSNVRELNFIPPEKFKQEKLNFLAENEKENK